MWYLCYTSGISLVYDMHILVTDITGDIIATCMWYHIKWHVISHKVISHSMVCDITNSFLYWSKKSTYLASLCRRYPLWNHWWYFMFVFDDITYHCMWYHGGYLQWYHLLVFDDITYFCTWYYMWYHLFQRWYCIFNPEHRYHQKNRDITCVITPDITYMWYCTWYCGWYPLKNGDIFVFHHLCTYPDCCQPVWYHCF